MRIALTVALIAIALCGCSLLQPRPAPPEAQRPAFTIFYTAWVKPDEKIATVKDAIDYIDSKQ